MPLVAALFVFFKRRGIQGGNQKVEPSHDLKVVIQHSKNVSIGTNNTVVHSEISEGTYESPNENQKNKIKPRDLPEVPKVKIDKKFGLRWLESEVERELKKKNVSRFLVAVYDVDGMTQINKKYGREVGDEVLSLICRLIGKRVRKDIYWNRFGEDTMFAIFPGTEREARSQALDIMYDTRYLKWKNIHPDLWVTCSSGLAYRSNSRESPVETVARACIGLEEAKKSGKDKACDGPIFWDTPMSYRPNYQKWPGIGNRAKRKKKAAIERIRRRTY